MAERPKLKSESEKELDKVQKQFDDFDQQVKDLTLDRMNEAPKLEQEQQTRMSTREMQNSKDIYLKPRNQIQSREKFNERFRESYNFDKEYVQFVAENKELIGETIEMWTKPYPGMPAEFWEVPVNKPVWGPRYLAEQIRKCTYHQLSMDESQIRAQDAMATWQGVMVADKTVSRLTAEPVSQRKSVFMGANGF